MFPKELLKRMCVYLLGIWNTKTDHLIQNSACKHIQLLEKKHPLRKKTHKAGKKGQELLFLTGKRKQLLSVQTSCLVHNILTQQLFPPIRLKQTKSYAVYYYSDAKENYFTIDNSYYCSFSLRENGVYKACRQHFSSYDIYISFHQWQPLVLAFTLHHTLKTSESHHIQTAPGEQLFTLANFLKETKQTANNQNKPFRINKVPQAVVQAIMQHT